MKKSKIALLFLAVLVLPLCLTSCAVNWFGQTVDVPWYYVAIPIAIVSVTGYLLIFFGTYECPHCKNTFKPKPYEFTAFTHCCKKRLMKCPACKRRGFCRRIK